MKYLIVTIISVTFCLSSYGQFNIGNKDKDIVTGSIIGDNVHDLTFFRFELPIWNLSLNKYNFSIYDAPIGAYFHINDNFVLQARYKMTLLDELLSDSYGDMYSIYESNFGNEISGTATYYFYNEVDKENLTVELDKSGNTIYVTEVEGTQMTRYGMNVGFSKGYTPYDFSETDVSGTYVNDASINTVFDFNKTDATTQLNYSHIIIGAQRSKIANLTIDTDKYGVKKLSYESLMTFNFMIPISNRINNVYAPVYAGTNPAFMEFNIDEETRKMPVGITISYRHIPINRGFFGYMIEGGYFPGIWGNKDFFLNIGINISLGNKVEK